VYSNWAMSLIAKEQWFDYLMGQETLLLPKATRLALGPIQPHIEWVMGIFPQGQGSQGAKRATHLHPVPRLILVETYLHFSVLFFF